MPCNEVEDGIHNLFEVENSFQGQHPLQAADGSWPVVNYNQSVGKQREIGTPLNFNLQNFRSQQLDSVRGYNGESLIVPLDQNYTKLTPTPENFGILSRNHYLNNGLPGCESFGTQQNQSGISSENTGYDQHNLIYCGSSILKSHQENESCDSPTLTTNSERSEITEASTDFNYFKGQQQLFSRQNLGISQFTPMQQSGYNDMQLLQQHIMFKQLQDLQRQQQLQQLGDVRQQNTINQLSSVTKQPAGGQFSPLINGTPVHDASQMLMNLVQRGASPTAPGASKRVVFPQEQGQAFRTMGFIPQQSDTSLYGTPVASSRANVSQYSHLQGMSDETVSLFTKPGSQAQKAMIQSSGAFIRDHHTVPPDQTYMSQGAFISNPGLQGKDIFGPASLQGFNNGTISGNFPVGNNAQLSASTKELSGRQERVSWPGIQQKTVQLAPSQGLVPLDPIEEKILYNMDDNLWDTSVGRRPDLGAGSFSSTMENTDFSNAFPSIQSGSWSALMQSAVAEASSSDTGLQEEWSGLTFQNTEQSTENQFSNIIESEKQQIGWVDNNLQSASSFSSKPMPVFNESDMGSGFPGFQQPGNQFSTEQRENLHRDGSSEQRSLKVTSAWVDCGTQKKQSIDGSQQVHSHMHLDNAWAGQIYEHSEADAHQQRISSHDDFGQLHNKPKGNIQEAMYRVLWKTNGNFGVSSSRSPGGVEQLQSGTDNNLVNREELQGNNNQATGQRVMDNYQSDYLEQPNISSFKENQIMRKIKHQTTNGPHGFGDPCGGESEYVKQQKSYQRETSSGSYNSKGLSGHDQGNSGQLKFFADVSSGTVKFDEGRLLLEEAPSRGDIKSVGACGSNIASQTSQNMLELLHKVDHSREGGTAMHSGSLETNSLPRAPEAETNASIAQVYSQPSSQGFGLRLAPPSQRLPNSNIFLSSQGSPQTLSYLSSGQVNSESWEKNQTWVSLPYSAQSLPPANELSQGVHLDGKSSILGPTGVSSYLNMQGSSVAAFSSSPSHMRNQPQMQNISSSPTASQVSHGMLPSTASKSPPFNLVTSQDSSRQTSTNPFGQQFPVLEAVPVTQPFVSGMSRQGELSKLQNVWNSAQAQQHLSGLEQPKVPINLPSSIDPPDNIISTTKGGYVVQAGKVKSLQPISSDKINTPQLTGTSQVEDPSQSRSLDTNALSYVLSASHSLQEGLDGIRQDNHLASTASERNFAPSGHSLKPPISLQQNYSQLHQVQEKNNAETDPSKSSHEAQRVSSMVGQQLYDNNSRLRNPMENAPSSVPVGDSKMLTFLTGAREDLTVKATSQSAMQNMTSHEMVRFGQNGSQSQPTSSSFMTTQTNHGHLNLHMAPSWFKQYGTFRNGQMLSMSDARIAKSTASQFPLEKPSQNLQIHTLEQLGSFDGSQATTARHSAAAALGANQHFSGPYLLSSGIENQSSSILRSKKRKAITTELLPWHKEVSQGSHWLLNISTSEQEWALATNRLYEKLEDDVEMLEDVQPLLRSKRRLVLTTQLMQLLLRPAPASILSADATSYHDSVLCITSRLALGDACCLTYSIRKDSQLPSDNSDSASEKFKISAKRTDQKYSEVLEELTNKAKQLENDFQRLDRAASVLDLRVECQELERFAVINRFAKFHIRGPADGSGGASSASTPKPFPQRYVSALPMPRNIPEGVQCISL